MPSSTAAIIERSGFRFDPNSPAQLPPGTTANDVLKALQRVYGTQQYDMQKSSRWPYYSYVNYPTAGASVLNFFGQNSAQATNGLLQTNIEEPGNLGNYSMFIQSIAFDYQLLAPSTAPQPNQYTVDTTAIYSDLVHGFAQGGASELKIGTNTWDVCPRPFLYSPPGNGRVRMALNAGGTIAYAQNGNSPFEVTLTNNGSLCFADLERRAFRRRILKNPLFLPPQQNFQMRIIYDAGPIPVIATSVLAGSNQLFVGCIFDGTRFAPVG